MTDLSSDLPDGGQADASLEWEDEVPEEVLAKVENLFSTLTKAIRAFQLYDENNPVYQRFVSGLADAFRLTRGDVEDAVATARTLADDEPDAATLRAACRSVRPSMN